MSLGNIFIVNLQGFNKGLNRKIQKPIMMKVLDRETSKKEDASQMIVVCDITDN